MTTIIPTKPTRFIAADHDLTDQVVTVRLTANTTDCRAMFAHIADVSAAGYTRHPATFTAAGDRRLIAALRQVDRAATGRRLLARKLDKRGHHQ